jgi:TP901 family phage tail tape measure protein
MAFGSDRSANFVIAAKDAATKPLGNVGRAMGKLKGVGTAAFIGIAGAAASAVGAITAFAVDGVKNAIAFQTAMLNVNSIAKATPEAFRQMQDSVLELSKRLPQSAETLAQGLYDISSSGFAGADGIKVLEAAAKAASAGLAQTSESAAGITAVLNAYGLGADEAARVSDILFKTVDRGVITFPELAAQIGKTTALSAPLGVKLEEVAAGIATLTKNGIDAENATTQLNAIMAAILKPSDKAAKYAHSYGIELSATELASKGLAGMLDEMIRKTRGSSEALAMILGDARAVRGGFVLAKEGGAMFNEELALMQNAAGATDTALSYQEQGLAYQMGILGNNMDAIGIKLGEKFIPKLMELTKWITEEGLPAFEDFLAEVGPIFDELANDYIGPVIDSIAELFSLFDDGDGSINLLVLALTPLKLALEAIKIVIDAIVAGLKFIGIGGGSDNLKNLNAAAANAGYGGGSYVNPMNAGVRTPNTPTTSGYTSGYGMAPVSLTIGTTTQNQLAYKYGQGVTSATGTRTGGR